MKSRNLLWEDHGQILRVLNVLEEMAARVQRGQEPNEKDVKGVVAFLKGFGDSHHQGKEEFVVFPALLRGAGQKNHRELCHLVFEHNRQRSLIDGIADSMLTGKRKDFVYCAGNLVKILRTHLKEEDDVLLPLMESILSPADDERVVNDMKGYDRQWQDKELSGLLQSLNDLESKYLRKALTSAAMTA
jgi:hemerythrin-like domain-containing protein